MSSMPFRKLFPVANSQARASAVVRATTSTSTRAFKRTFAQEATPPRSSSQLQTTKIPADSVQREQSTGPAPKPEPYLLILFASFLLIPPGTYYYYEYRKQHMREKKEAILRDIQARVAKQMEGGGNQVTR